MRLRNDFPSFKETLEHNFNLSSFFQIALQKTNASHEFEYLLKSYESYFKAASDLLEFREQNVKKQKQKKCL